MHWRKREQEDENNNKKLITMYTGASERIMRIKKNLWGANAHANCRGNDKDESYFIIIEIIHECSLT